MAGETLYDLIAAKEGGVRVGETESGDRLTPETRPDELFQAGLFVRQ